jgi:hypothetical protein
MAKKVQVEVPLAHGRRTEISMNSTLSPAQCRQRGVCETCGGGGSLGFVGITRPVEGRVPCPDC